MYRKVEQLFKGQIAGRWQIQDLKPGSLIQEVTHLSIVLTSLFQRTHSPMASQLSDRLFYAFILFMYKGRKKPFDKPLATYLKQTSSNGDHRQWL